MRRIQYLKQALILGMALFILSGCVFLETGEGQPRVKLITYDRQGNRVSEQEILLRRNPMRGPKMTDNGTKLIWNEERIIVFGKDGIVSFTPFSSGETIRSVTIDVVDADDM